MRAVVLTAFGGAETLTVTEKETPAPGPGQVLVATAATGVNFLEVYQRSGLSPLPLPFALGGEASGQVVALGEGVTGLAVGDRIATSQASGTYAEQFVVDAVKAVRIPEGIDDRTAAALPLQGSTAHYLTTSVFQAAPDRTALVHAGAGGLGLLLTQLLTAKGTRVITTVSTPEKEELSRAAGASDVLGYEGVADRVRELTDGRGVDVVYDGVGKDTIDSSFASLAVRGLLVVLGGASGPVPPVDPQRLNAGGSLVMTRPSITHFLRTPEELQWRLGDVFDAVLAGTLSVRIGGTYDLDSAGAAHADLEQRASTGKLLLIP